jgi:hypothetical protein
MNNHYKDQVFRFVRLFVMAFGATGVLTAGSYTKDAIVAAVVSALETAWREVNPTAPTSAIVPK